VAWSTPIPEILLAYESKIQFLQATNPFGQGKKEDDGNARKPEQMKALLRGAGK